MKLDSRGIASGKESVDKSRCRSGSFDSSLSCLPTGTSGSYCGVAVGFDGLRYERSELSCAGEKAGGTEDDKAAGRGETMEEETIGRADAAAAGPRSGTSCRLLRVPKSSVRSAEFIGLSKKHKRRR